MAASIYRFGGASYFDCLEYIKGLTCEERISLVQQIFNDFGNHDIPLREMEYANFSFDVTMDQGAYFELKRHRMTTQSLQRLTTNLGYATPRLIADCGLIKEYDSAMEMAATAYQAIALEAPEAASYVVPNGFNRRVMISMNLREAFHLCSLRTSPQTHFSARRVTLRILDEISALFPSLASYIRSPHVKIWQSRKNRTLPKSIKRKSKAKEATTKIAASFAFVTELFR